MSLSTDPLCFNKSQHDAICRALQVYNPNALSGGVHYTLHCRNCGKLNPLPHETLDRVAPLLRDQANGTEIVAVVCGHCMQVRNYDLAETIPPEPVVRLESLPPISNVICLGTLECEDATCNIRWPVLGKRNSPITDAMLKELNCPNGHPFRKRA